MRLINKRTASVTIVGAVASALVVSGAGSANAGATTTVTLRSTDLSTSDTRTAGHVAFLKDGLAISTDDNTSQAKAAGYFAVNKPLAEVTRASLTWHGTDARPGQQIVFDVDAVTGNGNDYNVLVGEPVYGDNWWLTTKSSDEAKAADPSGSEDGGNGSAYFGTLEDWAAGLKDAHIVAGGFSLGSGIKGNGVITAITYGDAEYNFTNSPVATQPTVVNVTGSSVNKTVGTKARLIMKSNALPKSSVLGQRLQWKITVDGLRAFATRQQFGERDVWVQRFAMGTGAHQVSVFKNGVEMRHFTVLTGTAR